MESFPSDDEDEVPAQGPAQTWKEKRQAQKAVFDRWMATPEALDALKPKAAGSHTAPDELQSIHALLAQQQHKIHIIKSPREYQIELFERAKKENTIAVLDTGSGKTLIAVLLLRWILDQELERRETGQTPRISFFLVASVALVYQQHAVLECNLDHPVARFVGADGVDRWSESRWIKIFEEHKVIVCTAEILFQCLSKSFITLKQINLLIFDEAHHAKKNHPFARIIKDFYLTESDSSARPRIFGMTASPVDAKTDVVQAASELESLLDCRIATTTDMSLTEAVKKPKEELLWYPPLPQKDFDSALLCDFRSRYKEVDVFTETFSKASHVARHLGSWCADRLLLHAFAEERMGRYELQIAKKYSARRAHVDIAELDAEIQHVRDALAYAQSQAPAMANPPTSAELSTKIIILRDYLTLQFERETSARCIVFVQERKTAQLLNEVFERLATPHMRCSFLIGQESGRNENSSTFRQQVTALLKFRKGELNCLFATSVAEEGLDVPDCNLVVRFDMYRTMIEYVQSRGRARSANSKFVHLVERDNSVHRQVMEEVRFQEARMRRFCDALPEDRRLVGNEDLVKDIMDNERLFPTYTDKTTGAKLTYGNAMAILAHFISVIPTENNDPQHPTFVVLSRGQKFIAEVILPTHAPISSIVGRTCTKKTLAKRSAAFEACLELRRKDYLDAHLMPVYQKKLPAIRNALLAVESKARTQYLMRAKPSMWEQARGGVPDELWLTLIDLHSSSDKPHRSIVLLTRAEMPEFPAFPIYLYDERVTVVSSTPLFERLRMTSSLLSMLTTFTLRIFKDVFSKTYEEDVANMSYWLAPTSSTTVRTRVSPPREALDWELLEEVSAHMEYTWAPGVSDHTLLDLFLVDKWDGSRKFFSESIDTQLTQTDKPPEGVAPAKYMSSILDYTVSLYKTARANAVWKDAQPVIEASKVNISRRNMLAPPSEKEMAVRTRAYLVPEPLRISVLPPAIARSCFAWPAIVHRLESYLIGVEACTLVGVKCSPALALEALTKDSDNSGEHGEDKVNFRRGMGENYERLEFIGDTFLKLATSISTFIENPNDNEFEFHVRRMLMLCNKNLFRVACDVKLYEYIRTMAFSRRLWYPEGLVLLEGTGKKHGEPATVQYHGPQQQPLGDKTIADVCEAMIGAAFIANDQPGAWKPEHWDNAVATVTRLVDSPDHTMRTWRDYSASYDIPAYQTGDSTATQRYLVEMVGAEHAYRFKYPALLYSAFLHPSMPFVHEHLPNYQRLEFLGDALLDMASVSHLFNAYPDKDPQWLTEHKMAMVSNKFLGALCVSLGFHKHLRYQQSALEHAIRDYATELLEARRTAGQGCRDYWTTVPDPPKCLADIVESYVGAMFIDSDFDYAQVQRFFDLHMKGFFEDMTIYDSFANHHPCTRLHHTLQTCFGCSDYRLMVREVPGVDGLANQSTRVVAVVMVHDQIVAHDVGQSGRYARVRVAQKALHQIEGMMAVDFRARFACQCRDERGGHNNDLVLGATGFGLGIDCAE